MSSKTKTCAGVVGSMLLLSMGANAALAAAEEPTAPLEPTSASGHVIEGVGSAQVSVPSVQGVFAYTQDEVDDNAAVARAMGASKFLCGAQTAPETSVAAEDWVIAVEGAVANPYALSVAELQDDPAVQHTLMGCSCAGNPADGNASVNARVTGVSVTTLLKKAGVEAGANTVVFRSADGYEVALPLTYVTSRLCPIVFDVNGSPIAESAGGTNQLWLGATSARYFARDIVSIAVEQRDEVPAAPGTPEAEDSYANLPNVGVDFGGEIA